VATDSKAPNDDDAAEARGTDDRDNGGGGKRGKGDKKKKEKGQNKNRQFGSWHDTIRLCNSFLPRCADLEILALSAMISENTSKREGRKI
jgi:hypothetical protein